MSRRRGRRVGETANEYGMRREAERAVEAFMDGRTKEARRRYLAAERYAIGAGDRQAAAGFRAAADCNLINEESLA